MSQGPPQSVAITGAIASGKSRCARYLGHRFGLTLINADAIGRTLILPGGAAYNQLQALLPKTFFHADGTIDRRRLRAAIFTDNGLRQRLERLLHPLIRHAIHQRLSAATSPCVVEVPLLFEVGWRADFDHVVVVYACAGQRLRRLRQRDQLCEEDAQAALAAQNEPSLESKALAADHVIDNSGPWAATVLELHRLAKTLGFVAT